MKRVVWFILLAICAVSSYSQETDNPLVKNLQLIKAQQGDSIARSYLEAKKDSLEQIGGLGLLVISATVAAVQPANS